MNPTIEKSFVKQFEAEVHLAYQRQGSKLRPTVRNKTDVRGATTVFQRVGKGVASTKGRHGQVPVMGLEYSNPTECRLQDWYAGEWIDRLDELKTNLEERQIVANSGAYALGRKTDDLIIAALNTSDGKRVNSAKDTFNVKTILEAFEELGKADVPDDGERYAVVGWSQWAALLGFAEFSSAEYVGEESLPWRGLQARRWLGTLWIPHAALPLVNRRRHCFWYHKTAVGHGSGADVRSDITWHGDRAAHFVNNMMSQGAALIDSAGVVRLEIGE